jgi:hypothetical protein
MLGQVVAQIEQDHEHRSVRVQGATAAYRPQAVAGELQDKVVYLIAVEAGHILYAQRPVRAGYGGPHNPGDLRAIGRCVYRHTSQVDQATVHEPIDARLMNNPLCRSCRDESGLSRP